VDPGKVGGAENYLTNILKGLYQNGYKDNVCLLLDRDLIQRYDPIYQLFDYKKIKIRGNRRVYDLMSGFSNIFSGIDVAFFPHYISPLISPKKTDIITTIHDLQYLIFIRENLKKLQSGSRNWDLNGYLG